MTMNSTVSTTRAGVADGRTRLRAEHAFIGLVVLAGLVSGLAWNVRTSITDSGVLFVYAVEPVAWLGWLVVLTSAVRRRGKTTRAAWAFIGLAAAFLLYCGAVTLLRLVGGTVDLKSILIPRNVVAATWVVAGVLVFRTPARQLAVAASLVAVPVAVAAVGFSNTQADIAYVFWQNHALRTYLLACTVGTATFALVRSDPGSLARRVMWTVWPLLVAATTWVGLSSGSRLNAILVPSVLVVCLVVATAAMTWRTAVVWLAAVALAVVGLHQLQGCGSLIQYGLERGGGLSEHLVSRAYCSDDDRARSDRHYGDAQESRGESSSVRFDVWRQAVDDLRVNPVIGVGLRQYEATAPAPAADDQDEYTVTLTPHNFLLEYGLAYGAIGVLLYGLMMSFGLLALVRRRRAGWAVVLPTVSVGYILAASLFQPTLLNCGVSYWLWLPVAVLVAVAFSPQEQFRPTSGADVPGRGGRGPGGASASDAGPGVVP